MLEQFAPLPEQQEAFRILVVEDESIIAADMQDCLENLGYTVVAIAVSGTEAIAKACDLQPDLVLMDVRLKGEMDGIQAAELIWNRLQIPVIYATGFSDRSTLERAKLTRPFGYILKPVEERELYAAVETAMQQYRATQELQGREQWLITILRDMGDGVIVVDPQNRVRLMNLVAEVLTGWTQSEAAGQPIAEVLRLLQEDTQTLLPPPTTSALEQGTLFYLPDRCLLLSKTGNTLPVANTATPLRNEDGGITGAVVIFRDVTQRRIVEERNLALQKAQYLEEQMVELRKVNQLKDDFLNTVSHELRTPLANMRMAIEMLEIVLDQQGILSSVEDSAAVRAARYLDILREQCNQELVLVNDLLDLQRLNTSTYPLTPTSIDLQHWIPHLTEHFQERLQQRCQSIEFHIPPDLPALVSDLSGLTRILTELLNNACKYTPTNGTITLSAQIISSADTRLVKNPSSLPDWMPASVQITVCNSGVEIPPAELAKIFDQFYRVPGSNIHDAKGTGLGLTLVKKLVEHLQGSIWADSHSGETCFTIELPLSLPD